MGVVQLGSTITGSGVPANTTIVRQQSGPFGKNGVYTTSVATTLTAITLTFTVGPTVPVFPDFTPIVPPPPIGADKAVPPFPPPTPPPIGTVPVGDLIGPVIALASVPPSVAGIPQPVIGGDNPYHFPDFSSTFPVPTIVVDNVLLIGTPPPPQTPSTLNIVLDGWGPNVPPGAPTAPGGDGRLPRPASVFASEAGEMLTKPPPSNPHPPPEPPGNGRRRRRK